jgi:hypothetical protein
VKGIRLTRLGKLCTGCRWIRQAFFGDAGELKQENVRGKGPCTKRKKKKKRFWDKYLKKMISNFKKCSKRQFEENKRRKYIFRKTKKERWKMKEFRISSCCLQKNYINYCLNLSNISSEIWKRKWKQKILQKKRMMVTLKEIRN